MYEDSWTVSERYPSSLTKQELREAMAELVADTLRAALIEWGVPDQSNVAINVGRVDRLFGRWYWEVTVTWSFFGVGMDFMEQLEKTATAAQLAIDGI